MYYSLLLTLSNKNEVVIKYVLPEGQNQVFASNYMLYIPTEEELRKEIQLEKEIIENKKND